MAERRRCDAGCGRRRLVARYLSSGFVSTLVLCGPCFAKVPLTSGWVPFEEGADA